jgi:hypothetical protein
MLRGRKSHKDIGNNVGGDKEGNASGASHSSKRRTRERGSDNHGQQKVDGVSIVVTNTAHERMRKVSVLTIEDDDFKDYPSRSLSLRSHDTEGKNTENTEFTAQTDHEASPVVIGRERSIPLEDMEMSERQLDFPKEALSIPKINASRPAAIREGTQSKPPPFRRLESAGFEFPAALVTDDPPNRQRIRSSSDDVCLAEIDRDQLPSSKENIAQPEEGKTPDRESDSSAGSLEGVRIIQRGNHAEVRGFVAPSTKQRQLMRKVSGLGMEDPVFAAAVEQTKPKHNPNIFEDMDLGDVPEDMRDMFSLASDRTDSVNLDDDILESPISKPIHPSKRVSLHSSWRGFSDLHKSCSSLPPLGLDPEASPTKEPYNSHDVRRRQTSKVPPPPSPPPPPPQLWSSKTTSVHRKSNYVAPPPVAGFTPPSGTFLRKKTSKAPGIHGRKASALFHDNRLAAQVDAMFQMPVSNLELSSDTLKYSKSSFHESFNNKTHIPTSPVEARRRGSNERRYHDSHRALSTRTSVFVPPGSVSADSNPDVSNTKQEFHRNLPSMDSLYPDAKPACRSPLPPSCGFSPKHGMTAVGRKSVAPPKPMVITVKKSRSHAASESPHKTRTSQRDSATGASPSHMPPPVVSPRFHDVKTARSKAQRRGTGSSSAASPYTVDTDAAAAFYHDQLSSS